MRIEIPRGRWRIETTLDACFEALRSFAASGAEAEAAWEWMSGEGRARVRTSFAPAA